MTDIPITCISGAVTWVCRHCGHSNRSKFNGELWKMDCANRECQRTTALVQSDVPTGLHGASRARFYQWWALSQRGQVDPQVQL